MIPSVPAMVSDTIPKIVSNAPKPHQEKHPSKTSPSDPEPLRFFLALFFVYGIVIMAGSYYIYKNFSFGIFVAYFANVDLISRALTHAFPEIFDDIWARDADNIVEYLSTRIIDLVALSGVFIHGIMVNKYVSDLQAIFTMIALAFVTFTFPEEGYHRVVGWLDGLIESIPVGSTDLKKYDQYIRKGMYLIVAFLFILIEYYIIETFLIHEKMR
jgi:hypothetical protein